MGKTSKNESKKTNPNSRRIWRRLALALPISLILHLLIFTTMRPNYRKVADFPVDMEITEGARFPAAAPNNEAPPSEPPPEPETPGAESTPPPNPVASADHTPAPSPPKPQTVDGGITDGGPKEEVQAAATGHPGGKGNKKGGICFHNLFPYSQPESKWLLWLSMTSLRQTSLEKHLVGTLRSFALGKNLTESTGLDPSRQVEGLLVTTQNIMEPEAFRVIASYDSGEAGLRRNLNKKHGRNPSFAWAETNQGHEAWLTGSHRWHMVGSGRVLVITSPEEKHAALKPDGTGASSNSLAANRLPENPFSGEDSTGTDPSSQREKQRGSFPHWPSQVTCLTEATTRGNPKKHGKNPEPTSAHLEQLARSFLSPDATGRWPVALLATSDPRALGIGRRTVGPGVTLEVVRIRGFFSDPIRIEGEIILRGDSTKISSLAKMWKRMALQSGRDPFLAMAGLSHVFDRLKMDTASDRVVFSIELTESQIRAALVFLQLQGEIMDRRSRR